MADVILHPRNSSLAPTVQPGRPYPLGADWDGGGVNFAIYAEEAEAVDLLLFDRADDDQPAHVVPLTERTGPVWHAYLAHRRPGQLYGYRVHGPWKPEEGLRFNASKVLLDPYAAALGRPLVWHDSLFGHADGDPTTRDRRESGAWAPLGMVVENSFEWGDDRRPDVPWPDTVIYETHVRGLTMRHPDVPARLRGTYLGVASEPILEHLRSLGVTTISLLPVHAFVSEPHLHEKGLRNYWGYNPLAYFAPEPRYAAFGIEGAVREFKMMVRTLHAEGFEVLLDVVYNHTAEGDHLGPTLSWRGIDNRNYYKLEDAEPGRYVDYTGTGNTLDAGNPYVLQLITDSLRYWVEQMHVDGFRFDLASALARELYDVNMLSPFFTVIQQDPVLSRVKLIAEPWDVGPGGYQVGNFPWHWAEWNGRFRDAVRSYWAGHQGRVGELATRVSGSSDLYSTRGRRPFASVNFVTAHDGYTLQDLVSYVRRHNQANGENNRDGDAHNLSQNFGVEGPSDDPEVVARRHRAKRSLMTTLVLSQGVPMLLGGDELGRSQQGNNNAYCQDNDVSWYDWSLDADDEAFLAHVKALLAFRKRHPLFRRRHFLTGDETDAGCKDVAWLGPDGTEMREAEWQDRSRTTLGMLLCGPAYHEADAHGRAGHDTSVLVLFQGRRPTAFRLPDVPDGDAWCVAFGNDAHAPGDTLAPGATIEPEVDGLVVLEGARTSNGDAEA